MKPEKILKMKRDEDERTSATFFKLPPSHPPRSLPTHFCQHLKALLQMRAVQKVLPLSLTDSFRATQPEFKVWICKRQGTFP
jgi:hypothetical protein